jgi:uncharacterized protein YegJ (DUF2314 family)
MNLWLDLIVAALTLCAFASGCSKKTKQNLTAADVLITPHVQFEYAVYLLPGSTKNPSLILRDVLAKEFPALKLVDELPHEPAQMLVSAHQEDDVQKNYAPPSERAQEYSSHGLSKEQSAALKQITKALKLDFGHSQKDVWAGLRQANELVEQVARETGGLVWDEETREIFSPDAWHKRRIGSWQNGIPDMSTQTTIHVYDNGEFDRAISLGMSKAGLPDVVIQELPISAATQIVNVINLFSQALAEERVSGKNRAFKLDIHAIQNASIRDEELKSFKEHATGIACLSLQKAELEEGDNENRLIRLTFDRYVGNDSHAKQESAVAWLFGWSDSIHYVEHTDELMEASRKARLDLPRLQRVFAAGLQPDEYIEVKAPFSTPDGEGHEWMWVEVQKWKHGMIEGTLENQPEQALGVHAGQLVKVKEEDVFDYIRKFSDGHEEGNSTGEIIGKMQKTSDGPTNRLSPAPPPSCSE